MNKIIIVLLLGLYPYFSSAVTTTELNEQQLSQIQFGQKIGTHVSPALSFQDETGKTVHLGDYAGKPTVLILGYYGCPMLCTLVLNGAADCLRNLKWSAGQQYNVIFASIDPNETPALAAEKKATYIRSYGKACAANWHLLTGNQASITKLADEVGFHYAYDPAAKQFAHPSGLVILSADGKVARYFFGVVYAAADVDAGLRAAALNQAGPPESSFTLLCFHYAPVHGKYGKLVMDAVRVSGLLGLAGLVYLVAAPAIRRKEKA